MRVTFVYPDVAAMVPNYAGEYYSGIASLSAALKKAGHSCTLIHICDANLSKQDFIRDVVDSSPDLIAFSSTTTVFPIVAKTAGWLKEENIGIPTIAGGVHAILRPIDVLNTSGIDFVCLGEGEDVLVAVCNALIDTDDNVKTINGLGWHRGKEAVLNPPSRYLDNLDELAIPDRSIFNYESLNSEKDGLALITASRGCPYKCTYCCNEALRHAKGEGRPVIRFHSVDYVIKEAKTILDNYEFITRFQFDDDILFLNKAWATEFAEKFPTEIGLPFTSNIRPNMATDEMVSLLKKSGCDMVKIGLESGNDYIRNVVLARKITRKHIIDSVKRSHEHGIKAMTFNIVGLPFETPETVMDTIKLNADAGPDGLQYSIFYPFPGTKLYDECAKNKFISERTSFDFFSDSIIDQPTISKRKVIMFHRWFPQLVKLFTLESRLPTHLANLTTRLTTAFLASGLGNLIVDMFLRILRSLYILFRLITGRPPKERFR